MQKRNKLMAVVITIMLIAMSGVTGYYRYAGTHFVETDDAKVDGNIVHISPQITGKINAIYVAEGDFVREGDVIARQLDTSLAQGSNIDLAVMKSPLTGIIVNKVGNVGEVGTPGQPVAMVCDLTQLFITANVEETEVHKLHAGQKVEFSVDAFPQAAFSGRVVSIGKASLSTFALLSTSNTSGSYTKVVQRVPVKISIDDYQGHLMLPGMNAVVKIHIAG